jgi:soluble lytic murein transglycosylase-like protein
MTSLLLNARRFYQALKSLLALVGLAALAAYYVLPERPTMPLAAGLSSLASVAAAPAPDLPTTVAATALEREQDAVAEYIAKRYRIADHAAAHFVSVAYRAAEQHRLDALLVLAVMAIESRYNPVAESVMGAKGLMQVIPKYHQEKLFEHGGDHALLEPEVNIHVGAQILREYQRRFGDTETALQMYAGALDEPTSQYANKVFAEKARLDALRFKLRKTGQSV